MLPAWGEWFRTKPHNSSPLVFLTSTEKCFIHNHCEITSERSDCENLLYSNWNPQMLVYFVLLRWPIQSSGTQRLTEPLLSVSNDDDQRSLGLPVLDIIGGLRQVGLLWLDHFDLFCLEHVFRLVDLNSLSLVLGFGQNKGSCFNRKLRLAAYPEGAFRDADSTPRDGQGVFERGGRRVGAGVNAVAFALHLHLHRKPLRVLAGGKKKMNSLESRWNASRQPHSASGSYLSSDFQRSLPSILGADCELCRLVKQAASLLQAWTEGLHLHAHSRGSVRVEVVASLNLVSSQCEETQERVLQNY